jgi:hypothetical protein
MSGGYFSTPPHEKWARANVSGSLGLHSNATCHPAAWKVLLAKGMAIISSIVFKNSLAPDDLMSLSKLSDPRNWVTIIIQSIDGNRSLAHLFGLY